MAQKFVLLRRQDLRPDQSPIAPELAWQHVERVLANPPDASVIRKLASMAGGQTNLLNRGALRNEILRGSLVLLLTGAELPSDRNTPTAAASVADQIMQAREAKTWIEFELLDMDGEPYSDASFRCMLPDGEIREGKLDTKGRVRFDGIPSGNCVFVLPEFDRDAWERVG